MRIVRRGNVTELYLYAEIRRPDWFMNPDDVVSAESVIQALAEAGNDEIVVRVNSPGGDVFESIAIYQALSRHEPRVSIVIDALAASGAALVAMAGDEVTIAGNALLMIHRAWTIAWGNVSDMEKVIETLRKVDESQLATFTSRVAGKATPEEIEAWLDAETWMSAQEAVDRGFADRVGDLVTGVAAQVPQGRFKNTPKQLLRPSGSRGISDLTHGIAAYRQAIAMRAAQHRQFVSGAIRK